MTKKKDIKVYLTILTSGWVRVEMAYRMLLEMYQTPGVQIYSRPPQNSFSVPVSSNRNIIVKDFLETDHDYLMMIDHDVVPLANPMVFAYANKDIVGFPAKVRQGPNITNWSAYVKSPNVDSYLGVDFTVTDPTVALLLLNNPPHKGAVGTGCILIHRRVLEAMKPPWFMETFDKYGRATDGEDFNFCKKADKLGFEIYTAPKVICEHFHYAGLHDMRRYEPADGYFARRQYVKDKKCIIGLGSGRCGTMSLATLLTIQKSIYCSHEYLLLPWEYNGTSFLTEFPKLFFRERPDLIQADVSSWYLPYVHTIMEYCPDTKFICLKRDLRTTAKSFSNWVGDKSAWTAQDSKYFDRGWAMLGTHKDCFPKFDLPKQKALRRYLREYYEQARALQKAYPQNFKIFKMEEMNTEKGVNRILDFLEIPEDERVIDISINNNKQIYGVKGRAKVLFQ